MAKKKSPGACFWCFEDLSSSFLQYLTYHPKLMLMLLSWKRKRRLQVISQLML
ncbi:hypothetical protein Peur_054072 [Populus x canadensis]